MGDTILEARNLKKYFKTPKGMLHAVDDINFSVDRGKTLGIVGESGCGKTTTGRCLLRLVEPTSGEIIFEGKDITRLGNSAMRRQLRDMQIIFQDPYSSLDPRKRSCRPYRNRLSAIN
jgi:peptide/nickel transport system ATP-binding protein